VFPPPLHDWMGLIKIFFDEVKTNEKTKRDGNTYQIEIYQVVHFTLPKSVINLKSIPKMSIRSDIFGS